MLILSTSRVLDTYLGGWLHPLDAYLQLPSWYYLSWGPNSISCIHFVDYDAIWGADHRYDGHLWANENENIRLGRVRSGWMVMMYFDFYLPRKWKSFLESAHQIISESTKFMHETEFGPQLKIYCLVYLCSVLRHVCCLIMLSSRGFYSYSWCSLKPVWKISIHYARHPPTLMRPARCIVAPSSGAWLLPACTQNIALNVMSLP